MDPEVCDGNHRMWNKSKIHNIQINAEKRHNTPKPQTNTFSKYFKYNTKN